MKDKVAREGLESLCHTLGLSYSEFSDRIDIGQYTRVAGGNDLRRPVTNEELGRRLDAIRHEIHTVRDELSAVCTHLGLYLMPGPAIKVCEYTKEQS